MVDCAKCGKRLDDLSHCSFGRYFCLNCWTEYLKFITPKLVRTKKVKISEVEE